MKNFPGIMVLLALFVAVPLASGAAPSAGKAQRIAIEVTRKGFEPSTVHARAGQPVVLVVTRTVEKTCAKEIVIKDRGIRRALPLNKPVEIPVNAGAAGALRYACGMDMISGTIVID